MASILVVDDEPSIRRLLRLTLGPDHQIGEAADGAEALRLLRASPPDIAILDVAMPVMDGLAVCHAVRTDPSLAQVGIIIVSAYADAADARVAGADGHLRKPFRPLELLALVDDVLASRGIGSLQSRSDQTHQTSGGRLAR
jgi:CheY-like chemotaxis protein